MSALIPPSTWVTRFSEDAAGPVLDIACGAGRHSRMFLAKAMDVTAVDRDVSRMADIADHPLLTLIATDLETDGDAWRPAPLAFKTVIVTNYLWRPLLPSLVEAGAPGGRLIYETFAQGNARFSKPSNPAFLLSPGELQNAVEGKMKVAAFEHGMISTPQPAMIQRIFAVKNPSNTVS